MYLDVAQVPLERRSSADLIWLGRFGEISYFTYDVGSIEPPPPLPGARFEDLRLVASLLPIDEAGLLGYARAIVSWLINRTVTFSADTPPSLAEFARFAAVSWTAQAVNYAVFAFILLTWPGIEPVVALILASMIAMFVSYAGFRFGVFKANGR